MTRSESDFRSGSTRTITVGPLSIRIAVPLEEMKWISPTLSRR